MHTAEECQLLHRQKPMHRGSNQTFCGEVTSLCFSLSLTAPTGAARQANGRMTSTAAKVVGLALAEHVHRVLGGNWTMGYVIEKNGDRYGKP